MEDRMTTEKSTREWKRFVQTVAPGANEVVRLGLWKIRPNRVKDGWWSISENSEGGAWGTNLPYRVAEKLWACIEAHYTEHGEEPLAILPDAPLAMTRLRES